MLNLIVAGIGTDVGKTVASAILVKALGADYWKPIQSGADDSRNSSDSFVVKALVQKKGMMTHPESYSFLAPLSPHAAAAKESIIINPSSIIPPATCRPLVIESAGGLLVPFRDDLLQLDLFSTWNHPTSTFHWVLVSRHYLGSINHTLLSLEALASRNINLFGIIFNGEENQETERVILKHSKVTMTLRLLPETSITSKTITKYATLWKQHPALLSLMGK